MLATTTTSVALTFTPTSWTGSGTGGVTTVDPNDNRTKFDVGSNWSGGAPSDSNTTATIQFSNAGAVYLSQNTPYIHSLTVSGSSTLPTLYIQANLQTDTLGTSNGNINQSAGSVLVNTIFGMADPNTTDSYVLSGGTLTTSGDCFVTIGDAGAATFTHSGGVFNCEREIEIGQSPSAVATYFLSGAASLTTGNLGLGYGGKGTFDQSGGTAVVQGRFRLGAAVAGITGPRSTLNLSGGSLTTATLLAGGQVDIVTMNLTSAAATLRVQNLFRLGSNVDLHAANGFTIHMSNANFDNLSTSPHRQADLSQIRMEFDGGSAKTGNFEVAGADLGPVAAGFFENFSLAALALDAGSIGQLKLVDARDNSPGSGKEALYVDSLVLGLGSKLDLNGYNLYYHSAAIDPAATVTLNGGQLIAVAVPEPVTWALVIVGLVFARVSHCRVRRRG